MSVQDVIKKSILEADTFSQAISLNTIITIVMNMVVAIVVGYAIYRIYKKYYNGVVYSRSYALTLVGMTILTCMVTLAISTNIVISLGMVGALSIVRYRTAIKEPLDLLYMFWAITSGITIGASMYILVLIGFVVMAIFIALTFGAKTANAVYILSVQFTGNETADQIIRELNRTKYVVKSRIFRDNLSELTLQVECKDNQMIFVEKIQAIEQVKNVSFVKYNGEYHG